MIVPTPQEFGLPERFDSWRPKQEEALAWMMGCTRRIKAMSAPTGFGKSPVVVAYALWTKLPTCIVTDTRGLQDQYMRDFESIGMVDIRGRRNYPCDLKPDYSCEDGYQAGCPYKGTIACLSSQAEMRAATSTLVVTNYDKWCAAKKYGQGMQHFQQVIFDEGHETNNALSRAMQVVIHHRERERHICLDPPSDTGSLLAWKAWAVDARAVVESELKRILDSLRGQSTPLPAHVRHALHMRNLNRRLGVLSTCNPGTEDRPSWVVEEFEKGFQFDPVRPGRYAESALLLRVPSVVIVSATLRPKTLFMAGQGADTFDFREFDSEFEPSRNPLYWVPTMRVDKRASDFSRLWVRLDQVASARRDRKGIVHTISFARRDEVLRTSRWANSMLINEKGDAPTPLIDEFKAAPDGAILVSPSVGQGHDFPGPACEWQFVTKVPFPPPSAILKARTADDPEYPYYLAMLKLVQIVGRACRFGNKRRPRDPHDQCENIIADDHIEWFLNRYGHLAPKSFHVFFQRVTRLPQPPPRLPR